ncbi:uncharacterized protein [Ranitomeya imitator]
MQACQASNSQALLQQSQSYNPQAGNSYQQPNIYFQTSRVPNYPPPPPPQFTDPPRCQLYHPCGQQHLRLSQASSIHHAAQSSTTPKDCYRGHHSLSAKKAKVSTISDPLSEDLLYKRIFLIYPSKMDMDRDKMAERILHITLEILFHLNGEDYTVVKTSSERCQDPVSEGLGRPLSPVTWPPPHLIHEDINDQKILELTYKMIELLSGEVPMRCQDVAVYFSMDEWEYLEGYKDLYKDFMMEVPQPLTSPVR